MINVARFSKKHEPFLHAAFGTGTIEMISTEAGKNGIVYMTFRSLGKPKEIGDFEKMKGAVLKDTNPQIMFSFSKVESIDTLIAMLKKCKSQLIKKQK